MSIYKSFDGMCWPNPGEEMAELEWRLRYKKLTTNRTNADSSQYTPDVDYHDCMAAAAIVGAYRELVTCSKAKRERVVKMLNGDR